ncbi:O-antigen ligase family protein [Brevundimonas sp.]|uniref:O-antigen ligase family protein n=1 Tax=Brevundimonas sp. TaxID=1871086 RepID=UPI0025BDCDBA|nr:O-antigen ligase [Brevundimonas sp.]
MRESRSAPDLTDPDPPLWERAAAIVVIVMLTGALVGPVFAPTQEETPILRLVWLPIYGIIAGLIALRADRMARAWPAMIALMSVVGLAYASKYWSIDPATTSRRVIALAITGAFAVYLGAVFRGAALPRLLTLATLLMGLGSVVMVFAFPAIGVHQDVNAGLWRGLWYEKNQMGLVMVAGATAASALLASGDPRRIMPIVTLALTSALVLATQSKTSLLCLMIGVGLPAGLWTLRRGGPAFSVVMVWLAVVAACAGAWLWFSHSSAILEALGKDPSLTGRTDIWASLMRRVAERPWTGYGYSAFWIRGSEPAAFVRHETDWPVPSAHNGWIDVLVQLGWPGVVLVGGLTALTAGLTILRLGGSGLREGGWGLAYLCVFVLLSLSESILIHHQDLPWVLFLAILTRALTADPAPRRATLAQRPARGYLTGSRIAAQSVHGPRRRPVLLR